MSRRRTLLALSMALAASHADAAPVLAQASGAACDASKAPIIPPLAVEAVVSGLSGLVFAAQPPGSKDWYLVEQSGQIRVARAGAKTASTTFLDLSRQVRLEKAEDERGLLGLAFAPDYATSGKLYVMVTVAGNVDAVYEYERSRSDPYVASPQPTRTIVQLPQSAANHNGGHLTFGPDGLLYLATGDGGGSCNDDQPSAPQNTGTLFGKVLRLDPRLPAPHVPPDNPFVRGGGDPRVLHYGLRNPFRFSVDDNGDLYVGDVGQDRYEEISFAPAGASGLNFGWPKYEGTHADPCGERPLKAGSRATPPIVEIDRQRSASGPFRDYESIIGGHVYRGRAIPSLAGTYLFGDYTGARLGAVMHCGTKTSAPSPILKNRDPNAPSTSALTRVGSTPALKALTAIVEDDDGELYFVANRSALLKLVARP
ncbi:MAG: PQQ-dependent sugar dehydrogenase [Polyangiales bacterium]